MHPSRLRLGPGRSRPLTDASPGSARPPGRRVYRAAPSRPRNIHTHAPFRTERQSFLRRRKPRVSDIAGAAVSVFHSPAVPPSALESSGMEAERACRRSAARVAFMIAEMEPGEAAMATDRARVRLGPDRKPWTARRRGAAEPGTRERTAPLSLIPSEIEIVR